jgi:hypothetical protein
VTERSLSDDHAEVGQVRWCRTTDLLLGHVGVVTVVIIIIVSS